MKRMIKNNLLGFIIGAIIFTGVGVYAANQYNASQITYNKNGQATVDAALNDLYTKANNNMELEEIDTGNSVGTRTTNRTKSVELKKGKYIFVVTEHNSSSSNGANTTVSITSDNQIIVEEISSTNTSANSTYSSSAATYVFEIIAKEDGTINLVGNDGGTNAGGGGALHYILLKK